MARAADLAHRFERRFDAPARVYRAPGRVNLIGEHTDYNDGFVLPAAIGLACYVAAAPRDDGRLVIESEDLGEQVEWQVDAPEPTPRAHWSRYVLGVAALLRRRGPIAGVTLLVSSEVPMGSGLSSSAALEVASALALADLSNQPLAPGDAARLCQEAEIAFVGTRCGIMDQFVASHARQDHALLVDCRSLESRPVPLPADVRLAACNTMTRHTHAGGEYNRRREECEAGVARIRATFGQVRSLRDVDLEQLEACRSRLPDAVFNRCRHVVSENARTHAFARALEEGRYEQLAGLMAASHASLRDDYEVSCPELDAMVEAAAGLDGVLGTRMTGGGFGGCTVSLVRTDAADRFRATVAERYAARTGVTPDIHVLPAGGAGARVL